MSEWINCSVRMPEEYEDVLVTDGEDVALGFYVKDSDFDALWTYPANSVRGLETHWQPLPEPPKD
ncbi:MAG: hypothetical protein [Caudoviricetes sp.]|nr:MAG: hypothetical protein [Caudoviricetes sp.]